MTDVLVPFAPPDRWVPLRGARNCRDLGGYLTRDTMRSVLRSLRREHGSMLGYALDIGVGAESIAVLRDRLLD
jgi:hypothetical protein